MTKVKANTMTTAPSTREPQIDQPPPEPDYVGDDYDGSDGAWSDPEAEKLRCAGCSMFSEQYQLDHLGAKQS